MDAIAAYVAIVVISVLNALTVYWVSFLGVYGDGTVGAMPMVQKVGWAWVSLFAAIAFYFVGKGKFKAGIAMSAKAIPYAILLFYGGTTLWVLIKDFLFK